MAGAAVASGRVEAIFLAPTAGAAMREAAETLDLVVAQTGVEVVQEFAHL